MGPQQNAHFLYVVFIYVEMSGASSSSSAKAETKASPKATPKAKAKAEPRGKGDKPTGPAEIQESRSPGVLVPTAQPASHGKGKATGKATGKAAATHADAAGAPPSKQRRVVAEEPVEEATGDQDEMVWEDELVLGPCGRDL